MAKMTTEPTVEEIDGRRGTVHTLADVLVAAASDPTALAAIERSEQVFCDSFTGTAELIVAAGLARWDQIPGQTACSSKMMCAFRPDGTRATRGSRDRWKLKGYKRIIRAPSGRITVEITVAQEEVDRRREANLRKYASAAPVARSPEGGTRAHLRLVWSMP